MSQEFKNPQEFEPVPSMPYENQLVQPAAIEDQSEGLDLIGFLRRRKAFVVVLGLLGVGVGYMMFQRQIPQYRSDAWVQVIHRNADPRVKSMMAERIWVTLSIS